MGRPVSLRWPLSVGWFGVAKEKLKSVALLFVRGLVGPFLFFAPSLVVATIVVGRSTLTLDETDWVAVFGIVYFMIQAVFEEFLLREAEASDSSAEIG